MSDMSELPVVGDTPVVIELLSTDYTFAIPVRHTDGPSPVHIYNRKEQQFVCSNRLALDVTLPERTIAETRLCGKCPRYASLRTGVLRKAGSS